MVRVDVVAGQPPPPAACPPPAPLGPHDMYCSPYGEFYSQEPYYVPPPEMCPQPPHLCTLHGDYGPVMPMGVPGQQQGTMGVPVQVPSGHMVQQIMDESGNVRHVFLSPQPPPPPNHLPPHLQHPPPQNHQHPPQHYGPSNGANGHQQSYYQIPPGYPPPHYHPPPMGPPPPAHHHMAPPSPPHPYHKDERTQRQHAKLRKKLDQKQRNDGLGFNSGHSTPALSPRKEFSNGRYRAQGGGGGAGGGGGSMVGGTSSEGEGGSSAATSVQGDEEDSLPLLDYLSSLQTPHVSEVTARTALVQWSPPRLEGVPPVAPPPCGELRYELLLGDKGRYKAIYSGLSLSCRVEDLRPGTEYSLCLQARSEGVTGSASAAAVVRTAPAEPNSPAAPRAAQRTRASLQLRWQPPHDNGASIQSYVLQYDEGKNGEFVDLCNTRMKQHHLQKLEASTRYRFRLAAINDVGQGPWSEEVVFTTCGYPPSPPAPPTLENCQSHALTLYWDRRPGDDTFTLQMEDADHAAQHGFIAAYNGREVEARCEGLMRYSNYVFRLQAHNEDGGSQWSEEVTYRTLPERPGAPSKPVLKGKKHTQSFKVRWEPPVDKGGTEIELYTLEMKSEAEFEVVYTGIEQEVTCDRLQPGHTYHLRVSCTAGGGLSGWSDIQSITTEPTVPGACLRPQLLGEPRPHSISLRWNKPDYDGGSPILEYNVELSQQENSRLVYKGVETECTVHELLPGRLYSFKVKAFSRAGGGLWSDPLEVTSGAAPPEPPLCLTAVAKSPFSIQVKWAEAPCNGGPIMDYRLEMSLPNDQDNTFSQIFNGLHHSHDVKNLTPFTKYIFRAAAINKAGQSAWSEERTVSTPAAVPAAPPTLRAEATARDASLAWQEPDCNGSPISHYRIELGERVFLTEGPIPEYQIDNLLPETTYRVKIQAVNEIGIGNYSPTLKFETLPPPPPPPVLQCVQQGHNFLKLKWGDGKNPDFTQYIVEMQSPRRKEYQVVYQGTSLSFRVKKLQECTEYKFRICAHNDAGGQGDYSEPLEWETTPAPPITLKAPRQVELSENSSLIEWFPPKGMSDELPTFIVQCCRTKDMEYKQVYRGLETSMKIEELEGGCEYLVRVCAEREVQGRPLQGAWSPVLGLSPPAPPSLPPTPALPSLTAAPRRSARKSTAAPLTDHQWAALFVFGFLCVAVFSVMAVKHFIDWHTSV